MTTIQDFRARKRRLGAEPIVMVTAYDEPTASIVEAAGIDAVLVGDSLGDVVLGYENTMHVSVKEMVHHVAAVHRARPTCLIVGDMPWLSYHLSAEDTVRNAARLVLAGAHAVKLEGGSQRVGAITAIIDAEIPVMGHIGLTPQSVLAMGGYRVQGRTIDAATALIDSAVAVAQAGCFAIVIEGVPAELGAAVTEAVDVPTIGIGAGPDCDGQVLVFHDLVGLGSRHAPKFVRRYANLAEDATKALTQFAADVRSGAYPSRDESYAGSDELKDLLAKRPPRGHTPLAGEVPRA